MVAEPTHVDPATLPDCGSGDPISDVETVLRLLAATGHEIVLALDLTLDGWPISVTRVIIPGLEGPTESPWYQAGPRVRRVLEQRR